MRGASASSAAAAASTATRTDGLSANWKSALCVTSLYDSYVQLQQENDALKAQVRELEQHKSELLAARRRPLRASPWKASEQPEHDVVKAASHHDNSSSSNNNVEDNDDDDEDVSRYSQLRREIQLLRSEKEQLELVHAAFRKQAHAELQTARAQYSELSEKYHVKYTLDPNSSKRVALAVQTLQDTLETVVHEKEELTLRLSKLQQAHAQLQQQHSNTLAALQSHTHEVERRRTERAKQSVVAVLQTWYAGQLARVWKRWTALVTHKRLLAIEHDARVAAQRQLAATAKQQREHCAAKLFVKLVQSATRRTFVLWRNVVQRKRLVVSHAAAHRAKWTLLRLASVLVKWTHFATARRNCRTGFFCLERLATRRRVRCGWRTWTRHVTERHVIATLQQELAQQHARVAALEDALATARAQLLATEHSSNELALQHAQAQCELDANKHACTAAHAALLTRIGAFFANRSDRQALQHVMSAWSSVAKHTRATRQRAERARSALLTMRLRSSVRRWLVATLRQRQFVAVASRVIARMQQLGVLRCLNAWRAHVEHKRAQFATVRHAIVCMAQRQLVWCFERWRAVHAQQRSLRQCVAGMCTRLERLLRSRAFVTWRQHVAALAAADERAHALALQNEWEQRLVQLQTNALVLRQCMTHWRSMAQQRRASKRMAVRTLTRWRNVQLARVVSAWQLFTAQQQRQREFVARWLRRVTTAALQSAWMNWQQHVLIQTYEARSVLERQELCERIALLQRERAHLAAALEQATAHNTVDTQQLQQELERTHHETASLARRSDAYARVVTRMAAQRARAARQRESFRAWKSFVARARSMKQRVQTCVAKNEQRCVARVLRCWRQLHMRRALLLALVQRLGSYMTRHYVQQCYSAWQIQWQHSQRVQRFTLRLQHTMSKRVQHDALRTWGRVARSQRLVRHTLDRMWHHAVHVRMREAFESWRAASHAHWALERKSARKALLASIQTRICRQWTSCSVRVVFTTWQRFAQRTQQLKQAQQRLSAVYTRYALCDALYALRTHAARCYEQRVRLYALLEKQAHRSVLLAFGHWRVRTARQQRQEIDDLRQAHARLCAEVEQHEAHAADMARASHETREQLQQMLSAHTAAAAEQRARVAILATSVRTWTQVVRDARWRKRIAQQLAIRCNRQRTLSAFASWRTSWRSAQSRCSAADAQYERRMQRVLFANVLAWRQHTQAQRRVHMRLRTMTTRHAVRLKHKVLVDWRAHVHVLRALAQLLPRVEEVAQRLRMTHALRTWRALVAMYKTHESRVHARQQRILALIMGRQGSRLEQTFASWRAVTRASRARRASAFARCASKHRALAAAALQSWRSAARACRAQRTQLCVLERIARRHAMRVAVATWRTHSHACVVVALRTVCEQHTCELERLRETLTLTDAAMHSAHAASATSHVRIADLEDTLASVQTAAHDETQQQQQRHQRTLALVRIAMRTLVSRSLVAAFTRWRMRIECLSARETALARVDRIVRHTQRRASFLRWKTRARAVERLARVQQRMATLRVRAMFDAWRRYSQRTVRTRVVLFRLCVQRNLRTAQCRLSVCGAFSLLREHAQTHKLAEQLAQIQSAAALNDRAKRTTRATLLLAKWSWRAYTTRLQRLHLFFSRCRGASSAQRASTFQAVIAALEATNGSLSAQVETLTREMQRAHDEREQLAAAAADSALQARAVHGSSNSVQGVQTLFRHLARALSTKELFLAVSSAFPQILHGSAGSTVMRVMIPS